MLPWPDRAVVLSWEDPTAQMGAEILIREGKRQGTIMRGLFFSPCVLGTLSLRSLLSPCTGFSCAFAMLQTVKVSRILVFSYVLALCV